MELLKRDSAFSTLNDALRKVEDKASAVRFTNALTFEADGDKYLSDYVNEVGELRKSMSEFNNLFEDFMMELEQADFEAWEETQTQDEENYYSERVGDYERFNQ
jgi:hypothetical protein